MPTIRLRDGRLLIAGGVGTDGAATGAGSQRAFVYDATLTSTVAVIDPDTGVPTGATATVPGRWDFTRRVADNVETTLGRGHVFGNAVRLKDGRVFVAGGHTFWIPDFTDANPPSALATDTDYFDPATGEWTTGATFAHDPGGGRPDPRLLRRSRQRRRRRRSRQRQGDHRRRKTARRTARRTSAQRSDDGAPSVMTPAASPMNSTYETAPHRIPPGTQFGGRSGRRWAEPVAVLSDTRQSGRPRRRTGHHGRRPL